MPFAALYGLNSNVRRRLVEFCKRAPVPTWVRLLPIAKSPRVFSGRAIGAFALLATTAIVTDFGSSQIRSIAIWLSVVALGLPWFIGAPARASAIRARRALHCVFDDGDVGSTVATIRATLTCIFVATAAWLVVDAHRRISLLIALLQGLAFISIAPSASSKLKTLLSIFLSSVVAWALALGFTSVPLDQWLLAAVPSTAAAPVAFAIALALTLREFATFTTSTRQRVPVAYWLVAFTIFTGLSLRTDQLLADWIPYHRTFWAEPANFIRQGAWPLWDFPSQYGVLSEVSLAMWPNVSTWQALYFETALVMVAVSCLILWLYTYRRSGFANRVFALGLAVSVVFSDQGGRHPMGWRIYPQLGLRFQWLLAIIALTLFLHRFQRHPMLKTAGYLAGYLIWAVSLAWSLESGVFAGVAWSAYVVSDVFYQAIRGKRLSMSGIARICGLLFVPVLLYLATEAVFWLRLGHGPDWTSYFEYSVAYQRDASGLLWTPNVRGAVWVLVTVLVAVGSAAVAAIRQRRYQCLPVIVSCWFGLWGVCAYYVGEPIEVHANGLAPVIAVCCGAILALERLERGPLLVDVPARAALVPLSTLLFAYAFGEPAYLARMQIPLTRHAFLDSTASFPMISGELAALSSRAGVKPDDDVIFPVEYLANKLELGELLPFSRDQRGRVVEHVAWLPISPIGPFNTLQTLPFERRRTYLERYHHDVRRTGWLVAYHRSADCGEFVPGLRRSIVLRSANYEIAHCEGVQSK